jgi:hypothetical protein
MVFLENLCALSVLIFNCHTTRHFLLHRGIFCFTEAPNCGWESFGLKAKTFKLATDTEDNMVLHKSTTKYRDSWDTASLKMYPLFWSQCDQITHKQGQNSEYHCLQPLRIVWESRYGMFILIGSGCAIVYGTYAQAVSMFPERYHAFFFIGMTRFFFSNKTELRPKTDVHLSVQYTHENRPE